MSNSANTIRDAIDASADLYSTAPYLICANDSTRVSFLDLKHCSWRIAQELQSLGLDKGDRVAIVLENGIYSASLLLGTLYAGLVGVPVNPRMPQLNLINVLNHCGARAVYAAESTCSSLGKLKEQLVANPDVIPTDATTGTLIQLPNASEVSLPRLQPGDDAYLVYSSGTIGRPKGVLHSQHSVLACGNNGIQAHGLTRSDRSLLVLPIHHVNAACVTLFPSLLSGGSVVVSRRFEPHAYWELLKQHRCTWSAIVPTIVAQLLDREAEEDYEVIGGIVDRIRFLRTSSAPLSPQLHQEFLNRFQLPLIQAMGQSEAGNVFSNPLPPAEQKIGSVGRVTGFDVRIVDSAGDDLAVNQAGDVVIKGAALMKGYWNLDIETHPIDRSGWFRTGDIAYRDPDGYFFIVGRSKEVIIKAGVNIAPREIDEVLESHPLIQGAAAVGVDDRYLGEDVVAFVVLYPDSATIDEATLLSYCVERLGDFKSPQRIIFTDHLPQSESGKVHRRKLAASLKEITPESAFPTRQSIGTSQRRDTIVHLGGDSRLEDLLEEIWKGCLDLPAVPHDENFISLGGYSMLAIESLTQLREKHSIVISLSEFFKYGTIKALAEFIREQSSAQSGHLGCPSQEHPLRGSSKPIPKRSPGRTYQVSREQSRMLLYELLHDQVRLLNLIEAAKLEGELNRHALQAAINTIVARHENLRTTIDLEDERWVAAVRDTWRTEVKYVDLTQVDASIRHERLSQLMHAESTRPYDLRRESGFRVTLVQTDQQEHILLLMFHHVVCDGVSVGILWEDLKSLYESYIGGCDAALRELPVQFGDFAVWQRGAFNCEDKAKALTHWQEKLHGAPDVLNLRMDYARPKVRSCKGARLRHVITNTVSDAIRESAARETSSMFGMFAAGLGALLAFDSGQNDILIGVPISLRDRTELQTVIGFMLETQVMRLQLSQQMSFSELLRVANQAGAMLYDHRQAPFDEIVMELNPTRDLSYSPVFQVMLNWREFSDTPEGIGLGDLKVESVLANDGVSMFDLCMEVTDTGEQIRIDLIYSTEIFEQTSIWNMAQRFERLLAAAAKDSGVPLASLQLGGE